MLLTFKENGRSIRLRPLLARSFLSFLFTVAAIALIRDTLENGHDFTVFWKGAQSVLKGESLYSLLRDGGMVFKYPPWILPLFFPFGLMSLHFAKFCWGVVEVLSLAAVVKWIDAYGNCRRASLFGVLISFWGLWAVHALDGQIALPMLAIALWAWVPSVFEKSWVRSFILTFSLSTKIFTLFPLLQNRPSKKALTTIFTVSGMLLILSVPALLTEPSHNPASLILHWKDAATSGGTLLTAEQIRGRYNPSLTSLILRLFHIPAHQTGADLGIACALALVLGLAWKLASRRMLPRESWLGWLALAPVIHPLPWWHLFVFSFPLAVLTIDRSLSSPTPHHSKRVTGLAILGVALICASTEKLLGIIGLGSVGLFLEMTSAKSFGVLLCAGVLASVSQQNENEFSKTKP